MLLWAVALVGAAMSWLGDLCGVMAARNNNPWGVVPTFLLFGCAAPAWYVLCKMNSGQFVRSAIVWNLSAAVLSVVAATIVDGNQTPRQWLGLALFLVALLVRG